MTAPVRFHDIYTFMETTASIEQRCSIVHAVTVILCSPVSLNQNYTKYNAIFFVMLLTVLNIPQLIYCRIPVHLEVCWVIQWYCLIESHIPLPCSL